MRPLRRPTTTTIHYHGRTDNGDSHSVTFSINGTRWEYFLHPQQADDCIHIVRVASASKGLAYAKRHAHMANCLDRPTVAQATLLRNRGGIASRSKRLKVTLPNV